IVAIISIIVLIMNIFYQNEISNFLATVKSAITENVGVVEKVYETVGKFITDINKKDNEKAKAMGGGEDIKNATLPKNVTLSNVIYTGNVIFPLETKKLTSPFDFRKSPFTNKIQFHNGLDLSAPTGTKIHCAVGGKVIKAEENSSLGKHIIIESGGGLKTTYGHCSKLMVKVGMNINANETIAEVGSTGDSTGPHLHFSTALNDKYFNPECIFNTKYIFLK
ncbi:MAG: M23 family metallopeptidase, partial [Oscillospiraceae bacterium]